MALRTEDPIVYHEIYRSYKKDSIAIAIGITPNPISRTGHNKPLKRASVELHMKPIIPDNTFPSATASKMGSVGYFRVNTNTIAWPKAHMKPKKPPK